MCRKLICLIGLVAVFAWSANALAATTLVDDFDNYSTGPVDTVTTNWKAFVGVPPGTPPSTVTIAIDPGDPSNKVLDFLEGEGSPGGYGILSGAAIIADGETKTLFFRCRQSGYANSCVGMTDVNDPIANSWGEQSNQVRLFQDAVQAVNDPGPPTWDPEPGKTMTANTWYNIWVVTDHATQTYEVYINSTPGAGANPATDRVGILATNPFRADNTFALDRFSFISWGHEHVYFDDIYVSDGEDLTAMRGKRASAPNPANVSTYDGINVTLAWAPGLYAAQHDVYFGTYFNDVNDADSSDLMGPAYVYKARQSVDANSYAVSGLIPGTTYYWRIDEVNDPPTTIYKGSIWRFTVNPLTAYNPSPPNGDAIVDPNVNLSWSAGVSAADVNGHKVYVDLSEAKVIARSGCDVNGVSRTDPNYIFGPLLTLGDTYYWAIDEVNDANTWPGPVWSFTIWPYIPIDDPNLVGWWQLEDSGCSKTLDSSGHNRHGTLNGSPAYATGVFDEAINLDGTDDWVSVGSVGISGAAPRTITGWAKMNTTTIPPWTNVFGFTTDSTTFYTSFDIVVSGGDAPPIPAGWYVIHTYYWQQPIIGPDLEWHHFAATYDGNTVCWYGDGELKGEEVYALTTIDNVQMGKSASNNNHFPGLIDDVRIYNKVLTLEEIRQIMTPPWAWRPYPADGVTDVPRQLTLTWEPGEYADKVAGHRVYFDPDEQKVIDRSGCDVNGVSRTEPSYPITTPLDLEWTYYWAVDEVNDACDPYLWEGNIWSFTTANYIFVDDFESYADDADLKATWAQLGDARLYLEKTDPNLAHESAQSMDFKYVNYDYHYYSEACRTYTNAQDWSASNSNVKALTLWFYGKADNDANEQMYVKLEDAAINSAKVQYDGDMNDLKVEEWQEWNIDLQDFSGVTLSQVKKITIGFGDGIAPIGDGTGYVWFDDIRLYPPRCVPEEAIGDFTGDCIVDLNDLDIMTGDWLLSDYNVPAEPNSDANLVALYEFATDANFNDTSGNGHDGDPNGDAATVYDAVRDSNVLSLDGDGDYVVITDSNTPGGPFDINDVITVACWIKVTEFDKDWQAIVTKGDDSWRLARASFETETGNGVEFACSGISNNEYGSISGSMNVNDGKWHHVAGVYDGSKICIYVDGILDNTEDASGSISNSTYNVLIGENEEAPGREWNGQIDDVRIYNRALSHGEIVSLAGESSVLQPLPRPEVDLHKDGKVNLKDYAVLANNWLETILWP